MDIVVVSNRVARIKVDEPITGGLAAALLPAVKESGAIWVGASARTREATGKEPFAEIESLGKGALATVELPKAHYRGYYDGFANSVLWPALHSRADLVRTHAQDYAAYREVNAFMARALTRFCRAETALWVQDYHFLPLGAELRKLGVARPIGFFLHTPFPNRDIIASVPHHRELIEAMLAFDLIGFQTADSRRHFEDYLQHELRLPVTGDAVRSARGLTRLGVFPIGIDVDLFASRASRAFTRPDVSRLRASLHNARLVIGVDRLEYSKGLANRVRAFAELCETQPSLRRAVSLLQIAVPSRGEVGAYRELRTELATLVSEVNGRFGEADWTPIRYLNKGFSQTMLAGFYRAAHVGLITPLNDGMNLVAKEYVAAQNPVDPGVLVLSEFAGAARQLQSALLVNPHDVAGMARALGRALAMPLEERRDRWGAMMKVLRASSVQLWFADFVRILEGSRSLVPLVPELPAASAGGGSGSERPLVRFERLFTKGG